MNDFGSDGLKCRLQGMVIRDEFLCPIMYQLFRDPVIAYDGHTYERSAIENWLEDHQTSPRTGNKMVSSTSPLSPFTLSLSCSYLLCSDLLTKS
jgi:hypothetical protein